MKQPQISVVIPAYNEEKYIGRCLASLKKQTITNFEIIVVDNNCTDKTVEIARSYGAIVVHQPIQGMTPAREKGFETAQSPLIARTDADATVPPDWLERIVAFFSSHPDAVAITGGFLSPSKDLPNAPFMLYTNIYSKLTKLLTGHGNLHGPNMAVRTAVWKKTSVHMNDKHVHEDVDLACHMAVYGNIYYLPHLGVTYSVRRIKRAPLWTAIEYFIRYIRTLLLHHPLWLHPEYKPIASNNAGHTPRRQQA